MKKILSLVALSLLGSLVLVETALAQELTDDATQAASVVHEYIALAIPYALKAVGALLVFLIGRSFASWCGNAVRRLLEARSFDATLTKFFSNLTRIALLAGVILGILGWFGVETTSFAALIGAAGLAVGLAFQGTLSSFAAGVMLLTFRPFKVGDWVTVGGESGTVDEVSLFTTDLLTLDNRRVIIPNANVFGNTITNFSAEPKRRVIIAVGTEYPADLDKTREVLEGVCSRVAKRLPDEPIQVVLTGLGSSSIDWSLRVWCESADYWDVFQALTRDTKVALDEAGIGIPFPQMDVHLDQAAAE